MASNKWSSLCKTAARRSRLVACFSNHLLRNFGAAMNNNNFCTIDPAGTPKNLCTISSCVAAAEFKFRSSAASSSPSSSSSRSLPSKSVLLLPTSEVYGVSRGEDKGCYNQDFFDNYYEGFFCLGENRIKRRRKALDLPDEIINADCKGSSQGWLAFVSKEDCRMYLVDLFSPSSLRILDLPSIHSLPRFKEAIPIPIPTPIPAGKDILDYEIPAGKDILDYEADGTVMERSARHMSNLLIKRLAISSHDLDGDLDFVVLMCTATGDGYGLAFSRNGDTAWTPLPAGSSTQIEDVLYSRNDKLFYCIVAKDGQIQAWDFNRADGNGFPKRTDFDFDIPYRDFHYPDFFYQRVQNNLYCVKYYLVESPQGEILFLVRYSVSIGKDGSFVNAHDFPTDDVHLPIKTAFFAAFKLDFEKQIGLPVNCLGDTALFVGVNESFSLSTRNHPELMANSIYFADDKDECIYDFHVYPYGGDDIGVYNFENYSITPLYSPPQFKKIRPPPVWVLRPRP